MNSDKIIFHQTPNSQNVVDVFLENEKGILSAMSTCAKIARVQQEINL
jgi:hypothetical protein